MIRREISGLGYLSEGGKQNICSFLDHLDSYNRYVHGDFHPNNIMVCNGELMLIDLGGFSVGCPMFDIATTRFCLLDSPEARAQQFTVLDVVSPLLTSEESTKIKNLLESIPETNRIIHGDCHVKNIMIHNREIFLIDLDTLSRGYPVIELGHLYYTYTAFEEMWPGNTEEFMGIPAVQGKYIRDGLLAVYFAGVSPADYAANIVRHGKPWNKYGSLAEITVQITGVQFALTLRDYCHTFDPVTYYEEHSDDRERNGIRIVMNSVEKVSYINAFDSNNTIILDGEKRDPRVTG